MSAKKTLSIFRKIAWLEGWSYLILLGIAMPLKYWADMPLAVKYVGWAHGVLFVLYIAFLLKCVWQYRWGFFKMVWAFAASLIPFGTFILDKQLKKELEM